MRKKLKTQDIMGHRDVSAVQAPLVCPLCKTQPDSHPHLFFECIFSSQVWDKVKVKVGLPLTTHNWEVIIDILLPDAHRRSVQIISAKLVLAASVYYIWQERNSRLFRDRRRTNDTLAQDILHTVRLKLLTFRFKKSQRVERFLSEWDPPISLAS